MKEIIYPDWVEIHRTKGITIRKVKNGYGLYKCTSVYVKGKYPKTIQEYLGMVTEVDGFIPKTPKMTDNDYYLEYGLSHFIILNFKRSLSRNFNNDIDYLPIIYLGIVYFIFGDVNEFYLKHCALTVNQANDLNDYLNKISNTRYVKLSKKIQHLLDESIPDTKDRNQFINALRLSVIPSNWNKDTYTFNDYLVDKAKDLGLRL